ncbi:MAG: hypothetical protein ABL957_14925, partial [Parvularculaceae bacterium]
GYGVKIAIAAAAAGALRVGGILLQGSSAATGGFWLQYAWPGLVIVVLIAFLVRGAPRLTRHVEPPKAALAAAA